MTDREAIEILQEEHDYCQELSYVISAIKQAIIALQEREERERGCEYCTSGTYRVNTVTYPQYAFCPMCGRELKGERNV